MKPLFFILLLLISISIHAFELQSGDVILMSFNCYECRVIESETNSVFSHSGVVIKNNDGDILVGQSLTQVRLSSLKDFLKNKTPGTMASVYRPFELSNIHNQPELQKKMFEVFENEFKGLPFDSKYLWNNFDDKGRELLYCSEFIAKFLDHFLTTPSLLFPFSFKKNYEYWFNYFNGQIPEGELGNSPVTFSTDSRFFFLGKLE